MLQQALDLWATRYEGPPTVVASAPGRVNLIGEHTDYNEGFAMPAAIDLQVLIVAREAESDEFVSVQVPDAVDHRGPGWRRYASACRRALEENGHVVPGMHAAIDSTVPGGSGLSSSAALEVALLSAWNHLADLQLSSAELAELAWVAENEHVGVKVGRMDQMASAMGKDGCALLMDLRSFDVSPQRIPNDVELAILDTRKPRSLAAVKYNERVAECGRALVAISRTRPIEALRDATADDLSAARSIGLDETAYRRARHVISENERVLDFAEAMARDDLESLGEICATSHESLKSDYEVTVPELDAMVRAARSAPGCMGARMTGAGFGGCCVALIRKDSFPEFKAATAASYGMYGFVAPNIFPVRASDGASAKTL